MTLAVHITFYYFKERVKYLTTVVKNLKEISANVDIFIYTTESQNLFFEEPNIKIYNYKYKKTFMSKFKKGSLIDRIGLNGLVHPFYLSWENRKNITKFIDFYDVQMYLEDDIAFTSKNFNYWLKNKNFLLSRGYNLGFLRVEKDSNGKRFMTDVYRKPTEIIEIEGKKFIKNNVNPYCGFWIYDQQELKKFTKSTEWNFNFEFYGIREKSAIGWHGLNMSNYKGTLIPLFQEGNLLSTPEDCAVHHLPNNYLDHGRFCSLEFPLGFSQA